MDRRGCGGLLGTVLILSSSPADCEILSVEKVVFRGVNASKDEVNRGPQCPIKLYFMFAINLNNLHTPHEGFYVIPSLMIRKIKQYLTRSSEKLYIRLIRVSG